MNVGAAVAAFVGGEDGPGSTGLLEISDGEMLFPASSVSVLVASLDGLAASFTEGGKGCKSAADVLPSLSESVVLEALDTAEEELDLVVAA